MEFADECYKRQDCAHLIASSYDNPHMPKEEIDREIEKLRLRGENDVIKREYFGEISLGGRNAIFPMFDAKKIRPFGGVLNDIRKDIKNSILDSED